MNSSEVHNSSSEGSKLSKTIHMTYNDPNSLTGTQDDPVETSQDSLETLEELEEKVRVMKEVTLTESESVAKSAIQSLEMQMNNTDDWRKKASIAAKIAGLNLDTY